MDILQLSTMTVKEVLPYINIRDPVVIKSNTSFDKICHILFPEIFHSDGILVSDENERIVGRIGSYHVLKEIRYNVDNCKKKIAKDVMEQWKTKIHVDMPFSIILEIFKTTRFNFVDIKTENDKLVTVSTRSLLPLITQLDLEIPISTVYSKMILISEGIPIKIALDIMFYKHIRKIGIESPDHKISIIDDRGIIEHLYFLNKLTPNMLERDVKDFPRLKLLEISPNTSISEAAKLMMDTRINCSIDDNRVLTPHDLVTKVLCSQTYTG